MSNILVTFGSLEAAAADADAIAGRIDATLDQLESYLAPMKEVWGGSASTEYQGLQARWDTSAADLNLVLHQIATAIRTANENYGHTEGRATTMWQVH